MNEEMKIEELLNSFVDGELSVRQRTEVKRMAANDPHIAQRLRQLQKCRMLVSALPVAHAPASIMQNVRASLETRTLSSENARVSVSETSKNTGFILFRRVLAAAAVICIAAVLVMVTNMLTPPQTTGNGPESGTVSVADATFTGRLELKTNDLKAVNSVISRAIENSGFAESATPIKDASRYVYTLGCSKEGLNRIVADLNDNWDKLNSAAFSVDTRIFGQSVEIDQVTPSQIIAIVNQKDAEASLEVARDVAITNGITQILPDNPIISAGRNAQSGLGMIPEPVLVGNYPPSKKENGEKTVRLRIILSR
jgi:hypothetical protein